MTRPSVFVPIPAPGSEDWLKSSKGAASQEEPPQEEIAPQAAPGTLPDPTELLIQENRGRSGWKTLELPLVQHRLFPELYQAQHPETRDPQPQPRLESQQAREIPTWGDLPASSPVAPADQSLDTWGFLPDLPPEPPAIPRRDSWGIPVHIQQEIHTTSRIETREPIRKLHEPMRAQWMEMLEPYDRPEALPSPAQPATREPPQFPGMVNLATELIESGPSVVMEPVRAEPGRREGLEPPESPVRPLRRLGDRRSWPLDAPRGPQPMPPRTPNARSWPLARVLGDLPSFHSGMGFPALPAGSHMASMSNRPLSQHAHPGGVRHQAQWPSPRRNTPGLSASLLWIGLIFALLAVLAARQLPENAVDSVKSAILKQAPELRRWMDQR